MLVGQDRNELRQLYLTAWRKHCEGQPLSALESQIAAVIAAHPEYHGLMTTDSLQEDYLPEGQRTNPFLHMGLHLGLREQVATDRPLGIRTVFEQLAGQRGDPHAAEHEMMDCLAETLWEAQSSNCAPDEEQYLTKLRRLTGAM